MNINWYPGHMAKAKRNITMNLKLIDLIFEVIDARIPDASKIKDLDDWLKGKPKILIISKYDLCDQVETDKWLKYYKQQGHLVIGLNLTNQQAVKDLIKLTNQVMTNTILKRKEKGLLKRKHRVLVVGIPNVGKSTLINQLVGKRATRVGSKPGMTKHLNWIRISDHLELLDSPGLLWPKLENETVAFNLAITGAIKEELIPEDQVGIYLLKFLNKYYPERLKKRYDLEIINQDDIEATMTAIGQRRGLLTQGGNVDYDQVYKVILQDFKNNCFGGVTLDRFV
ncbi:MAG: ribosome biogenesis GTPase YlqF [Bacilli bacterium]|jgi:ribosome biogenesis GTPase A